MSHQLINQLQEKRANVWEQAKALLDAASADKRDLTAEEDQSWQRMNADIDGIDARVKSITEAEQREADAAEAFAKIARQPREGACDRSSAASTGAELTTRPARTW